MTAPHQMQLLPLLSSPRPVDAGPLLLATVQAGRRLYEIHPAADAEPPVQALLQQRYAWRGYRLAPPTVPARVAFAARHGRSTVGTLAVAFDGPAGLAADAAFAAELRPLREQGRRLCEFTRLALACPADDALAVLAALFQVAFTAAVRVHAADTLLLEVNPRHQHFYRRCVGARLLGTQRLQPRVQAAAVLLALEPASVQRRLVARSGPLYAHAFDTDAQRQLLARLLLRQRAAMLPLE